MENLLDWDTPPEKGTEDATLDPYSNTAVSAPLSEEAAKKRAGKIAVAFSGTEGAPSYEEILANVQTDREDRLKDRMAASEALKKQKIKQDVIRETIDKGDTSPDTVAFLQSLSLEDIVDKEGILEKKYAEWRIQAGLLSDETGTVDKALQNDPDAANARIDSSVDRIYRKERIEQIYNEVDALYQQTGIGRTVVDFVSDVLPLFTAFEDRNITPDNVRAEGFWPGDYRRSQIRDIFAMPQKEFDQTLLKMKERAVASGDYAPLLKMLGNLREYSAYAGRVDNASAVISATELIPGIGLIDIPIAGVKGVARGGKALAVAEARRKAAEAVSGAVSTPPTGQAAKAAGEAPNPPSAAPASPYMPDRRRDYIPNAIGDFIQKQGAAPGETPQTWDTLTPDYFAGGKKLTLYRGEGNNVGPAGPTAFWTTDPKKAAQYGNVRQIEVTQEDLKSFSQGHGGPDEFVTDNPKFLQTATVGVQSWTVGTKTYTSAREVNAALQQAMEGQSKRQRLLADEQALAKYAEERGETPEAMRKLLSDNFNDQKARVEELGKIVRSPEFKAAEAAERKAASNIKFTDKTDKQWNPETGMVEDIPQPVLSQKEVVLSAVAEKAAGDPRSLDELAQEINDSFTIDGQWNPRPGLMEEYQQAGLARDIADRKTGEVVTSRNGDTYLIKELTNKEMAVERDTGLTPLGFIRFAKDQADGSVHSVFINSEKIASGFKTKWWTRGNGNGFRSLPEDTFKTLDEFKTFVIEHELMHIRGEEHSPWRTVVNDKAKSARLEEIVNVNALLKMGKVDAVRKAYPDYFSKRVAPGPDPAVIPAPPKAAELEKKVSYPTPQTIDVPGTQEKWKNLKAEIARLEEAIDQTFPENVKKNKTMGVKGDPVKARKELQNKLKTAKEKLAKIQSIIDSKPYQLHVKGREELAKKISLIADQLKFPSTHFPNIDGKTWSTKKPSLEKELKELQAQWGQTDRLNLNPKAEVTPNTVEGSPNTYSTSNPPKKKAPEWRDPTGTTAPSSLHSRMEGHEKLGNVEFFEWYDKELAWINRLLASSDEELLKSAELKQFKNPDSARAALTVYRQSVKDLSPFLADNVDVTVDIPSPATGGASQVQIPATDEALWQIYLSNVEDSGIRDMADDVAETFVAHGDVDRAAVAEAFDRVVKKSLQDAVKDVRTLAAKLPSILDPLEEVVAGRPAHTGLKKIVNKLADGVYKPVIERQAAIRSKLWQAWEASQKMGALRWSDDVFEAVKDIAAAQTRKTIGSPNSAILNVKHLREWESSARTNSVVFQLGTPDGRLFASPKQADYYAKEHYGLTSGAFTIHSLAPDKFWVQVARVVDETDPNILNKSIQLSTQTPVSWTGAFLPYLKGAAGVSSEALQQNLRVSTHHAKALHEAFVSAAKDIGTLSKKELRYLDALLAAKRDVEKVVVDPKTGKEEVIRGEWFENAQDLEKTYKRAFGEFPSENVVSAYFTLRQMYDFDFLHRNLKLYTEKTRKGFVNAKLHLPWTDNDGNIRWTQQKEGVEVKVLDSVPSGNLDVLVLDSDTFLTHHFNTGKSGIEGIKALQEKGYKILQLVAPDQRPLKGTTTNYVNLVIAKDVELSPLSFDQLPRTEGGHIRYYDGYYIKQPRYEITENGEKLYLGDRTVLSASSEAEGMKRAAAMEKARQLLKAGDLQGLKVHLESNLPWTVGQFEDLFKPRMGNTGKVIEEPQLDLDTPIVWVRDGQGTNDAAKTHAPELASSFAGVRDTIDDPLNEMAGIGKKYTGEKDLTLHRVVEKDGVFEFENARMLSPLETMEQAWAEISRSIAADNLKIQASTNWVEEAASALLTPIEELRRNPWEALNNPQWNKQYGDIAKIRTLDAQRRQILNFLGEKDQLGSTLDWVRSKLMNFVFEKKGQAAADWVDDHLLPNVKNPLAFMRSFAFHTKMGFFNPIQLFLQSNTMINTWAITGNLARVGSALSGVMLMQMSRVNRTPEILAALGKKAEKLGWKAGEWQEMDDMFHRLSLHIVEGEVGTLDVMTNPRMFKGAFGNFLDKGLVFFREGEKAVRMNAFAVAYKEFRDKFPAKVITNADENRILSRAEVLSGMMNRGDMALWQKGLSGPMTQFWGYQARIMEQLLGKSLTRAEKLRLGTAFAAMYGMPVSLAAATMFQIPGWSTDDIRQYALENGININSGIGSIAMNGIPAELIRWMTSDENGQGGLLLSIGDRYGPGGLPTIKNLLEARDGALDALIDLAFGASGSITRDFFKNVLPQDGDIVSAAVNAPAMTLADYAGMFRTISTVNNTTKLYWALTTHRNLTANGMDLGDKSAASAWVSFVTGLEEQKVKDMFLKLDSLKDLKAANEELGREYLQQISKAKLLPPGEERKRRIAQATSLLSTMDPKDKKRYVKLGYIGSGGFFETTNENFNKKVLGN